MRNEKYVKKKKRKKLRYYVTMPKYMVQILRATGGQESKRRTWAEGVMESFLEEVALEPGSEGCIRV